MADRRRRRIGLWCFAACLAVWATPHAHAQNVTDALRAALAGNASDNGEQQQQQQQPPQQQEQQEDAPQAEASQPVSLSEAEMNVSARGTVTLNVVDLPLATVLRVLSLETNRNIIASPSVEGTVTASLHDVTFEEALDAILLSNRAAYRAVGKFIYVYTDEEFAQILEAENPPISRVFRLDYIPATDAETAVTPLLSSVGQVSASTEPEIGVSTDSDEAGGASLASETYLVVFDRPENVEAIALVIKELDVRPRQVLVEATILSAQLTDENALGVDFTILGGVDLELLGSTSQAIQNLAVGDLPTARFEKFNANATTRFTDNVPDGGVRIGILKDNVAVFVQALERVTDTVVLANPKILALNKQKGQVIVGRRDGFLTTTVTQTQSIQTVKFLETGTQLVFRPFIGQDGFIRMELHPEDSTGGLNAANLPFEQTTEVTTNVIVEDGQTILIGGLFREVNSDTRSQIPLLGDIPVLGTIFQSRNDDTRRHEVIILLTVHVVKDFDAYAKESWKIYQDVERLRVGIREGQMWFGRERIAQSLYKTALEHFAAGNDNKARWYVRMALHNNPRHLPSIKLQEDLRSRRRWNDEGTATRIFLQNIIMRRKGIEAPMFERPAPPFVRPKADDEQVSVDEVPPPPPPDFTEEAHVQG